MFQIAHKRSRVQVFWIAVLSVLFCVFSPLAAADLLAVSSDSGTAVYWDPLSGTGLLEKNGHQISFRVGERVVILDNRKIALTDAPRCENGMLSVSDEFLNQTKQLLQTEKKGESFRVGAIIVDPGHGGKDPGAMHEQIIDGKKILVKEKDITLQVGKMLYEQLKVGYPDKQILLTRDTDVFLSLGQRTDIANSVSLKEHEAVIYVSIHVNASLDKKASGYEVWYLTPDYRRTVINKKISDDKTLFPILNSMMEEEFTTESILIAKFIMDGLKTQIGSLSIPRGIKAEEWFVVRNANMPSVLVELGFLTNKKEAVLLCDDTYLKKAARGIYNGVIAFVTHFERSRGFTGIK